MDDYEVILKRKIDYYGETQAAHQLAAEEYGRQQFEAGRKEGYLTHKQQHEKKT